MMKKYTLHIAIFSFFLAFYIFFANGHYGGDGLDDYLTAESIVLDQDLSIHDKPFQVDEMSYAVRGRVSTENKRYSGRGIGMPILIVPFYTIGHFASRIFKNIPHDYVTQFTVSFVNPVFTALTALMIFIFLGKLDFKPVTCFLTTLCYGLCTMTLIYTRSGFSEPAATFFIFAAMTFLYKYRQTGLVRNVFISAFLLGFSLLIKDGVLIYIPLLFLYLFCETIFSRSSKGLLVKLWLAAVTPVAIFVALYFLINIHTGAYGESSLIATGTEKMFSDTMAIKGFFYYLFSSGKGYFFYNIPLFLALFAVKDTFKEKKYAALLSSVFICANLLFYACIFKRGSLFSWGPRYLYLTIPFICVFLAGFIEKAGSLAKKILLSVFCFAGFLVQIPCLFINFTKYLFFVKEKLGLQEYLINFMPELSPLKGSWMLLLSALNRIFTGSSLSIRYNPDYWFQPEIIKSLEGYDIWDIWWVNAVNVAPGVLPTVIAVMTVLVLVLIASSINIKNSIFKQAE